MKQTKKERQQNKQAGIDIKHKLKLASDATERKRKENRLNLLCIATIFAVGIIIYSNSFDCSFHFDDNDVFKSFLTQGSSSVWDWMNLFPSRPLGTLTFAFNYYIHGLDLCGYHFVNLMIHLANAFLVWWLTWLTLSTPVIKVSAISKHKTLMAFFTGLLFVSHPLATQAVTYIVQRYASLATLFYLLSIALFVQGRLWQGKNHIAWLFWGCSIISATLGMLTKEIVFTLPFAIIMYEYFFLKTTPWKLEIKDKGLMISFIMFAIFILLFFRSFSFNIFDPVQPTQGYTYSISWKDYLLTQFSVIITYIRLFILPLNQNFDYDYQVSYSLFEPTTFLSLLLLLSILALAVLLFRRFRLISFGIFWLFLTLSVESSVIPISQNVIFEHRTYLPGFGFFLALASTVIYFIKEKYLKIAALIILMIVAFNSVLTYQRNKVWKNGLTLWSDCAKKSPHKARVHDGLGVALAEVGNIEEAIVHYQIALKINPAYDNCNYNLANALERQGKITEAMFYYREAIKTNPNYSQAHNNLGIILEEQLKHDEAIYHFRQALQFDPNNPGVHFNLGIALARKGAWKETIESFRTAIFLNPNYEEARRALRLAVELEKRQKR